ncbi:hypothetical protein AAFF_G00375850 [Aldrovandia affinis]|uniref:Uncharacterized protein n=1 Tax=Aldrovandia affinis TaxID=143900 RepID=A0AAD7R4P7_9TELE|nr:hypothetical protein AAFF_G00375850 [Aldrovandia affinis]
MPMFGRGRARAPPKATAEGPTLVGVSPATLDPENPQEWGESEEPMGADEAGWSTKGVRKRPLSGEAGEARGPKEAPSIPIDPNPFEVLAGAVEVADFCTGMDIELASPLPYPGTWDADSIMDSTGGVLTPQGAGALGDLGGEGAP